MPWQVTCVGRRLTLCGVWALPTIPAGFAAMLRNNPTPNGIAVESLSLKIGYLILACNEESVIQKTLQSVRQSMQPSDALIVVADNCDDQTARIAGDAHALVLQREDRTAPGKSAALVWLVDQHKDLLQTFDFLIILDADSILCDDFSSEIRKNITQTGQVLQCRLVPSEFEGSPISTLIALSELIEQTVFQRLRSRLGLSVRLRGTGMVFKPDTLINFAPKLKTNVEDIALSLLLVEGKIRIRSLTSPFIYDPKPADQNAATRQRARWFRGQWNSLWKFKHTVIHLVFRGPDGWFMLGAIFLKPRWLKLLFLAILSIVFIPHPIISLVCIGLL
ncbi:glycosyltransferase, partial [bacterium]|nr:glycosyltransferase [bacterium]